MQERSGGSRKEEKEQGRDMEKGEREEFEGLGGRRREGEIEGDREGVREELRKDGGKQGEGGGRERDKGHNTNKECSIILKSHWNHCVFGL